MNHFPLVLPHAQVRRILDRKANRLIVTRQIKQGTYDVQDALAARRLDRYLKGPRMGEPPPSASVFAITVTEVWETTLTGLDFATIRAAGFKTQRDFYDEWIEWRRHIDPDELVRVCAFGFTDPGRFLHAKVHRGYTTNPAESARGEPQALSSGELKELAGDAARRFDRQRREEIRRRQARSLAQRLKLATAKGDSREMRALSREIDRLAAEQERAA